MRKHLRILAGLLSMCLSLHLGGLESLAAGRTPYTYTVTFYGGNHGSFADAGAGYLSVDNSSSGSEYQISGQGDALVVSGLEKGDVISFDAAREGAVTLEDGSKYYVKGVRQSGRDNDLLSASAFAVEEDQDYVVAYGIRGNMTSYVVRYQDAEGRSLAPERTYYGNVGDRPVVAFLYVEGYVPQAYNLTKRLAENTAENVFVFTYSRVASGSSSGGQAAADEGGGAGGAVAEGAAGAGTETGGTGTAAGGGAAGATAGTAAGGGVAGAATDAGDGGAGDAGLTNIPDEQVPQDEGPEDLLELDEEEVPLSQGLLADEGARMMTGYIAVAATAAAALLLTAFWFVKRRKKEEKEE